MPPEPSALALDLRLRAQDAREAARGLLRLARELRRIASAIEQQPVDGAAPTSLARPALRDPLVEARGDLRLAGAHLRAVQTVVSVERERHQGRNLDAAAVALVEAVGTVDRATALLALTGTAS